MYGINMDGLGGDERQARIQRASLGALYGLLCGTAFVFMATFIDIWLHPDLPLGVNWSAFAFRMPLIGCGLSLVGASAGWWHEGWQGLILGAITASAFALIVALFSSTAAVGVKLIVLIFILLPVAAMALPISYLLRWAVEFHARVIRLPGGALRAALLAAWIIAVGAGFGYFMKSPARSIASARFVRDNLHDLSADKNPLAAVAGVPERAGMAFMLYSTPSDTSTEGFDIHIEFDDGYKLQCAIIAYPRRPLYLTACETVQ